MSYEHSDRAVSLSFVTGVGRGVGGHAEGDTLTGFEVVYGSSFGDTLIGADDNKSVRVFVGGAGADSLDGRGGSDWLDYRSSPAGVHVDLSTHTASGGHAEGDTIAGFEHLSGSGYGDTLIGDAGRNYIIGLGGADSLDGGAGIDRLVYTSSGAGVNVDLSRNTASGGHAEGDTIAGFEVVEGSSHADTLVGNNGEYNYLYGYGGADSITGGGGGGLTGSRAGPAPTPSTAGPVMTGCPITDRMARSPSTWAPVRPPGAMRRGTSSQASSGSTAPTTTIRLLAPRPTTGSGGVPGRTALTAGAGRGIGFATVVRLQACT